MKLRLLIIANLVLLLCNAANPLSAEAPKAPLACTYQETRDEQTPINPKTDKPYTLDERNQEPFDGGSIEKKEIKTCLEARTFIKNHHIAYEDYRDAWLELAQETGEYTTPLLVEGGVIHAKTAYDDVGAWTTQDDKGGIQFKDFRDQTAEYASDLTEAERQKFKIVADGSIVIIRSRIEWVSVRIDSVVIGSGGNSFGPTPSPFIFSNATNFYNTSFQGQNTDFVNASFQGKNTIFFNTSFQGENTNFANSSFQGENTYFVNTSFHAKNTNFFNSSFQGRSTDFANAFFQGKNANFNDTSFNGENTNFSNASFQSENIDFNNASFQGKNTNFYNVSFQGASTNFSNASFQGKNTNFSYTSFQGRETSFSNASFQSENTYFTNTSFQSEDTNFNYTSFQGENTNFRKSSFKGENTYFNDTIFQGKYTGFISASFQGENTNFYKAEFKGNADFRNVLVLGKITLNQTTWEQRGDFRGMSIKELRWDSTHGPSNVQGVVDFREVSIGSAIIKEVRFQDLVDMSRATFGLYRIDADRFDELGLVNADFTDILTTDTFDVPAARTHLENNTFEKEADFLHVTFGSPTFLVTNRFRSALDLTGSALQADTSRLCLSYNRIQRLVLESKHMGNPPGLSPYRQWLSLRGDMLQKSKIQSLTNEHCMTVDASPGATATQRQPIEPPAGLYKTLAQAFRDGNDRAGSNEAWYLQTLAERDDRSAAGRLAWIFLDIPSRYTIDVWRTVWLSIFIMIVFYLIYMMALGGFYFLLAPWRFVLWHFNPTKKYYRTGRNRMVQTPPYAERNKAFRFRLFEPIHFAANHSNRLLNPWWDSAMLSMRAFLKLGLGTRYPNEQPLKTLMYIEWLLGMFMLIHFILALKNNLPFILPFLGAVN